MEDAVIELIVGEGCCIECAAKHEYNRMVTRLIMSDAIPELDEKSRLELLLNFLENADFAALRSSSESLSGIKNARCQLKRNSAGKPYVTIVDA